MKYYRKPLSLPEDIITKYNTYCTLFNNQDIDSYGFVNAADIGDNLLFTSLMLASNLEYNRTHYKDLDKVEIEPGKFIRHPSLKDNWKEVTGSTISKDMMTGLHWALWRTNDISRINRIITYSCKHFFKIGDYALVTDVDNITENEQSFLSWLPDKLKYWLAQREPFTRVFPYIPSLIGKVRNRINNSYTNIWQIIPEIDSTGLTGSEAHLQMLSIALLGEIRGYLTESQMQIVLAQTQRCPLNALFSIIAALYTGEGSYLEAALKTLRNESLLPLNRLPTSRDRSIEDLWMSDPNSNWQPNLVDQVQLQSGVDLTFVVSLALGKL